MFKGKHIVVGVTGSLSAYKAADLVNQLKTLGAEVKVVMTQNATEFVTPLTFQTLSQNLVACEMFAPKTSWEVEHITLAKWADCLIVAPATANTIAKFANGIADDILSSLFLAVRCPAFIAPAMNPLMYASDSVTANIETLEKRGIHFIGPDLINGAPGKMASTDAMIEKIGSAL